MRWCSDRARYLLDTASVHAPLLDFYGPSREQTFQENMAELLNLDPQYAPWNTERHSPAE